MNSFGISTKSYKQIVHCLEECPEIENVQIFGSRAQGNFEQGSDIDLALNGKNLTAARVFRLKRRLNSELSIPYHVDVVWMDTLSHRSLKNHINRRGKPFLVH